MKPQFLADKLLHSDSHIRFVAISNMDGNILASINREGMNNILTEDETEKSLQRAISSWNSRRELFDKTGEGKYALVVYEKLKRITIPIDKEHLIYITFDSDGNNRDVVQAVLNLKPGQTSEGLSTS